MSNYVKYLDKISIARMSAIVPYKQREIEIALERYGIVRVAGRFRRSQREGLRATLRKKGWRVKICQTPNHMLIVCLDSKIRS